LAALALRIAKEQGIVARSRLQEGDHDGPQIHNGCLDRGMASNFCCCCGGLFDREQQRTDDQRFLGLEWLRQWERWLGRIDGLE
jgi:hypothetical protein